MQVMTFVIGVSLKTHSNRLNLYINFLYLHNLLVSSVQMKFTEKHGKETPSNNVSGYQIFCYFVTSHLHLKPAISAENNEKNSLHVDITVLK